MRHFGATKLKWKKNEKIFSIFIIIYNYFSQLQKNQTEIQIIKTPVFESNTNKQKVKTNKIIELKLINTVSKKEMNLLDYVKFNDVIKIFGKPILIEKENKLDLEEGDEPWSTIKYNGIIIEFIGEHISDITIIKKQWQISNIEIGKTDFDIEKNFKRIKRKSYNYSVFEIQNFDGILFSEINKEGKIIKFGISTSQS